MKIIFSRISYIQSIIVLVGTIMLLSCKNDVQEVRELVANEEKPEMTGHNLVMIYTGKTGRNTE